MLSMTITSSGPFVDCSFRPNCSSSAMKIVGRAGSDGASRRRTHRGESEVEIVPAGQSGLVDDGPPQALQELGEL
jgi:hypothetical protein